MKHMIHAAALLLFVALALTSCHRTEVTGGDFDTDSDATVSATSIQGQVLRFATTDIRGKAVTMDDYRDAKVIMVNRWEPWCGPCVGEMPDLQKLYANYKDKGLVVLGVYGTEEDAKEVVSETGVQYPILLRTDDFAPFETEYVPTTFFVDGAGNVLNAEPVIGSRSYEEWEAVVKSYLS